MNRTQQQLKAAQTIRVLELNSSQAAIRWRSGLSALKNMIKGRAMGIRTHYVDGKLVDWAQLDWDAWSKITPRPEDVYIGTRSNPIVIPRTIVSVRYDKVPQRTVRLTRNSVLSRDSHKCQYCANPVGPKSMQLEHVHPKSRGGRMVWENIVAACMKCNQKKGDKTPQEAGMKLLRHPKAPPAVSSVMLVNDPALVELPEWRMYLCHHTKASAYDASHGLTS